MSGFLEVQHSFGDFNLYEFAGPFVQAWVHGLRRVEICIGSFADLRGDVAGLRLEEVDEQPNCAHNEHSRAGPDEDDVPYWHPRR